MLQAAKELEQVPGGAAESVEFPHDGFIARTEGLQHSVQCRAADFDSADSIGGADAFMTGNYQFPYLHLGVLVRCAHPNITEPHHESHHVVSHQRPLFSDSENARVRYIVETFRDRPKPFRSSYFPPRHKAGHHALHRGLLQPVQTTHPQGRASAGNSDGQLQLPKPATTRRCLTKKKLNNVSDP